MDPIITFIVILIAISLVERLLKGQRRRKPPSDESSGEGPGGLTAGGQGRTRPRSELEKLILEQLGIDLEPPSQVGTPSQGAEAEPRLPPVPSAPDRPSTASADRAIRSRRVVHPTKRAAKTPEGPRLQREPIESLRRAPLRGEPPSAAPLPKEPLSVPVSLEERAMAERGEARSLERPWEPADHEDFHRRYAVPTPVTSHEDFHSRYLGPEQPARPRRRGPKLPDSPRWTPALKAIVWSEILGSPKGTVE